MNQRFTLREIKLHIIHKSEEPAFKFNMQVVVRFLDDPGPPALLQHMLKRFEGLLPFR